MQRAIEDVHDKLEGLMRYGTSLHRAAAVIVKVVERFEVPVLSHAPSAFEGGRDHLLLVDPVQYGTSPHRASAARTKSSTLSKVPF